MGGQLFWLSIVVTIGFGTVVILLLMILEELRSRGKEGR